MPKKRHSPEQIIGKLRDTDAMLAAGKTIGQVCQSLEIAEQTFHRWRAQYGGMKAEEAKRLKQLEEENSQYGRSVGQDWPSTSCVTRLTRAVLTSHTLLGNPLVAKRRDQLAKRIHYQRSVSAV